MRTGELMGLEWGDIDDNYIHIRRAINAKGITTSGKNEFAARDFPQTRYTHMLLDSQKVYRVNPLDPTSVFLGLLGNSVIVSVGAYIAIIMVYLILHHTNCVIPFLQSIKTS